MISCIICSRNSKSLSEVSRNINETIGVVHEVVGLDNSKGQMGINYAYNQGIQRATNSILVFVHEDVFFHTQGWGKVLCEKFGFEGKIGCIGIAGGLYKAKAPTHWTPLIREFEYLDKSYLIQHDKLDKSELRDTWKQENVSFREVVFLDGVFIAIDKRTEIRFDESISGFHGYDMAVCLDSIKKGYKNYVTREILIEHMSSGSFNSEWIRAVHKFHKKNAAFFPISISGVEVPAVEIEKASLARFIELALINKCRSIAFYWWIRFFIAFPFSKKHFYFSKLFLRSL